MCTSLEVRRDRDVETSHQKRSAMGFIEVYIQHVLRAACAECQKHLRIFAAGELLEEPSRGQGLGLQV